MHKVRIRFWVESALAVGCGLLAVLTTLTRDWLEIVFGIDPDGHSGLAEWLVVAALAGILMVSALLARREWRRTVAARPQPSE